MVEYARAHWRGELSLAVSYWVNGSLLGAVLYLLAALVQEPIAGQSVENAVLTTLVIVVVISVITVWQLVGIWRSASNSKRKTGRSFWPGIAQGMVCLGFLGSVSGISTTAFDLLNTLRALRSPYIAEYTVERRGETDLILTGALNDESVEEIIYALGDPTISLLRVNSHGGLIDPATKLAHYVRRNAVMVMAEGECVSACVLLLAASPRAAIYPGTKVTFHRAEAVVDLTNPDMRRQNEIYLRNVANVYEDFSVAGWAVEIASRQQFWTPTIDQQIRMGLLKMIYDTDQQTFVSADEYCYYRPDECLR